MAVVALVEPPADRLVPAAGTDPLLPITQIVAVVASGLLDIFVNELARFEG